MSSEVNRKFRVLSIQSHVVTGYVGNKCATFPLQLLGIEVDTINSVQFSNHTGYKHCKGQVLDAAQLEELISGLTLNGIHQQYTHILAGYVGSESFLEKVVEVVKDLKKVSPDILFVCDPVLGDNGKLYVPKENLPVYQHKLLPLADILTPNQFEAELLTGIHIANQNDVRKVLEVIHGKGVKTVVITSVKFPTSSEDKLWGYASQVSVSNVSDRRLQIRFNIPVIPGSFTGAGDLFAAVFLAWIAKTNGDLQAACEKSASTLQHVLKRTSQTKNTCKSPPEELHLIDSKTDIENPNIIVSTTHLEENEEWPEQ